MTQTPRQRRKEKNRGVILDTALELISSKGFENFSLREVAKNSDYSPAALYKYFDSKQEIIEAVHTRENRKLLEGLNTVSDDLTPTQRLLEMCMIYIQFNLENRAYLSLVNNMISSRKSKEQSVPLDSPYAVFLKAVSEWASVEEVALSDDYGLEEVTYALWAQIHGMATLRLNQLKDFEADFDTVNRYSVEMYMQGLNK